MTQSTLNTGVLNAFTFNEMSISFTGQAFLKSAHSDFLNPVNKGQNYINRFIGKPIRAVARTVYGFAICILLAPLGLAYHTSMAIVRKIQAVHLNDEKKAVFALEHFKAAVNDMLAVLLLPVSALVFAVIPSEVFFIPPSLVQDKPINTNIVTKNPKDQEAMKKGLLECFSPELHSPGERN